MCDEMQQASRGAELFATLFAAELSRAHRAYEVMDRGQRLAFHPELQPRLQGGGLSTEEQDPSQHRGAMQRSLIDLLLAVGRVIAANTSVGRRNALIGLAVFAEILLDKRQQTIGGVATIGQQESRGDR